jgi:predicted dehydrogenase
VQIGLVGCGRWGAHILRDLGTLGCEVPVVARSDATRERARSGGATQVVGSVDELAGVNGVVVATPTSTHAEVVEDALALGVPVFVEKPLCPDPTQALALAERAGDRLFVMDKWRYHPGVLALAELARSGTLGRVQGLRTVRIGWGRVHDDVDCSWLLTPHDLAIALEVLGGLLQPVSAVAQTDGDRVLSLTGLMADDGRWHVLDVSERSPERTRRVELHCEDGVAVLGGGWDEHVSVYRAERAGRAEAGVDGVEERVPTPGELPLLAELRVFVEHLRGGPPPRSSAGEGVLVVQTIARLRELALAS